MSDLFNTIDVIRIENDIITIQFDDKTIQLDVNTFDEEDIQNIRINNYCPGCDTISKKGFYGTKRKWCSLSRKFAVEISMIE